MWGLMIRIEGARVDASVPGWLMNATATYAAIDQAKRAAHELAANPDVYGFDPDAIYTIFVQTWDRALTSVPSVAFGRDVVGQPAVGLVPDPYYMASQGYRDLRRSAVDLPGWASRANHVTWRGSVTGDNKIAAPQDLPRIRLALACRDMPNTDVGLIGVHSTMNNGRLPGMLDDFVNTNGLKRNRWDMKDFGRYRFTIDIDGHANAWGLLEKLIVGCCVLKVDSPFEQWYYDRIKPWQHYIPVKSDLSNLEEIIEWCLENQTHCQWIANNGARVAASLTLAHELPQTCRALLAAGYARRRTQPRSSSDRRPLSPPRFLLEDAIHQAENMGCLNQAIEARTRLIEASMGGAMDLMMRHDMLRQRGDFVAAQSDMEAAVAADPKNDEPPLRLGQFLASIGRHVAAIGHLKQAASRAPERNEIGIALAGSYLKLNWLDEAYQAVRHLPDYMPGWWADVRRAALAAHAGCREDARAILRARRSNNEFSPEQRLELATKLFALGRRRSAQRLCEAAIAHDPDGFAPVELAVDIIARWEGAVEALHYLSDTRNGCRSTVQANRKRASLLFELGHYQKTIDRSDSEDPSARSIVAFCDVLLKRLPDLTRFCRDWMERSPGEMLPAELVCAAQPNADQGSAVTDSATTGLQLGQFWHDPVVPADVRMAMDTWSDRHPGLIRHVYHEESARVLLNAEYGSEVTRAFDLCENPMMKAHYFRFAWLHRHGGIWSDVDQRCTRSNHRGLWDVARHSFAAIRSGYITGYLENVFLAAREGSFLMERALETATATILEAAKRGEMPWRWEAVGPGLLTRLAAQAICENGPDSIILMTPMSYRSYTVTDDHLSYKS